MRLDKISTELNEETFARVNASIDQILTDLPFLLDLTIKERKALPKFGDKSVAFVNKALEFATEHSEVLPQKLSLEEFGIDVKLYNQLFSIYQKIIILSDKVNDTYLQVGAEAYSTALIVYSNLKANKDLFDGSEQVLDELSKRFVRKSRAETITTEPI